MQLRCKRCCEKHEASGKDITLVYKNVHNANERFDNCDSVKVGENGEILGSGQNLFFKKMRIFL